MFASRRAGGRSESDKHQSDARSICNDQEPTKLFTHVKKPVVFRNTTAMRTGAT